MTLTVRVITKLSIKKNPVDLSIGYRITFRKCNKHNQKIYNAVAHIYYKCIFM